MRQTKSFGVLLAAVAVLAGCAATEEPKKAPTPVAAPLQTPDPCDLVTAATVADVVGPSLPHTFGGLGLGDTSTAECSWTFDVSMDATDNARRPVRRLLSIDVTSTKGDPCAEVTSDGTAVPGLGTKATIARTETGAELTFCRSGGFAKITWSAEDRQADKKIALSNEEHTDTLERVGREVDKRWKSARRAVLTGFRLPSRGPEPEIPNVCAFVSVDTLKAVAVNKRVHSDKSLATCEWELSREVGTAPGSPLNRMLTVDVVSYPEGEHSGWEQASTEARQFSHAFSAAPDPKLGGGSVVAEPKVGRAAGAKGPFAVRVDLLAKNFGGTDARPDPTNDELIALTRRVLTDVLQALPR
jgi:hypothetical protein